MKCDVTGCKAIAVNKCEKLFGNGGSICTCQKHTPDTSNRPAALANLPVFYRVERIG